MCARGCAYSYGHACTCGSMHACSPIHTCMHAYVQSRAHIHGVDRRVFTYTITHTKMYGGMYLYVHFIGRVVMHIPRFMCGQLYIWFIGCT